MPLYCYTTTEHDVVRDGTSVLLADLAAARKMTTDFTGELVKELDGDLFDHALELRVTDDTGLMLFLVTVIATEAPATGRVNGVR